MLRWIALSAFICIVSAFLGFSSTFSLSPMTQGLALLVMALAGMFLLGAFEAHESSRRDDPSP